jgi:microcompartment protein CcmK/EutM
MFLARIDGTITATVKHDTLEGFRLLLAQRLESDGSHAGEPFVVLDTMGARHGSTVLISTDTEPLRNAKGKTFPARLMVAGLVDRVYQQGGAQ